MRQVWSYSLLSLQNAAAAPTCTTQKEKTNLQDESKYYSSEDSGVIIDTISDLFKRIMNCLWLPQNNLTFISQEKLTQNYSVFPKNP